MAARRPVFLIAEPEPEQALSSRKLVIETAKFNVVTAHSPAELLASLADFPGVDAVVIHRDLLKSGLERLIRQVRAKASGKPIIVLSPSSSAARLADHALNSHDPEALVHLLRELFGDPRKTA